MRKQASVIALPLIILLIGIPPIADGNIFSRFFKKYDETVEDKNESLSKAFEIASMYGKQAYLDREEGDPVAYQRGAFLLGYHIGLRQLSSIYMYFNNEGYYSNIDLNIDLNKTHIDDLFSNIHIALIGAEAAQNGLSPDFYSMNLEYPKKFDPSLPYTEGTKVPDSQKIHIYITNENGVQNSYSFFLPPPYTYVSSKPYWRYIK